VSIDVVTDLLGEIVEIHEHDYRSGYYNLRGRGVVRALYVADNQLQMLVEHWHSAGPRARVRCEESSFRCRHLWRVRCAPLTRSPGWA